MEEPYNGRLGSASICCHAYGEGQGFLIPTLLLKKKPHVATVTHSNLFAFLQHETDTGARSNLSFHTTIRVTFHPRQDKTLVRTREGYRKSLWYVYQDAASVLRIVSGFFFDFSSNNGRRALPFPQVLGLTY